MTDPSDRCMVCFRALAPKPLLPDVLEECPLCHKWFCNRCSAKRGGRDFCGSRCGDTYFFAGFEGEDEIEED